MVIRSRIQQAILLVMVVLSASVWGVWDPDSDPNFVFNLDFEDNTATTTTDSVSSLVGTVELCSEKTDPPWEPEPNAMFNISGDFRNPRDVNTGDVNSCRISVEPDAIWDFGPDGNSLRTFGLWFGMHDGSGTFIGQENIYEEYAPDYWWQYRLRDGRIALQIQYDNSNALYMRTSQNLGELGITNDGWYHAAAVVDRRTRESSKMYVNGAPVDVEIIYHNYGPAGIDPTLESPVLVGGGEDDYDGLLDEIRLYNRDLNDVEISLLYQWTPDGVGPYALKPLPNHTHVSTLTDLEWEPRAGATSQELYFGTDPNFDDPCIYVSGLSGTEDSNTNTEIGGPLDFGTVYYWQIIDDINVGPVWMFTTEPGYATNPSPEDGARGVPIAPIDLQWLGSPDKLSFDVYFSDIESEVESNDVGALVADDITDSNVVVFDDVNLPAKGKQYYWRVVTNFSSDTIAGPVWAFRAASNEIIVNTSDVNSTHNEVEYPALTMSFLDANGTPTLVVPGSLGTDDVAIFNLSDVNISDDYEIVVIPLFDKDLEADMNAVAARITSRPMAMHVTGDFIFNGRLDISGEAIPEVPDEDYSPKARCGGYRGPINAGGETTPRELNCYDQLGPDGTDRFGSGPSSKYFFLPNAKGLYQFGPGAGGNGPYCVGGGGGHGGYGGDCSRGYMYGDFMGGASYSDEEVPVPFGGSGGGYGKKSTSPGGAGGGGVEIAATGNIILGPNAEILAEGGRSAENAYPGGGGAGGSVRIIAGGNFSNAGVISVDGGVGGNSNDKPSKCSGGGAAGRVAIFYDGTCTPGQISADGGAAGFSTGTDYGETEGDPGEDGTIYISSGSPKKASAPTPRDKDDIYYVSGGSGTIDLKWYSGYGGTTDEVFWGTTSNPTTSLGTTAATRGQHSITSPTVTAGNTYYWKVETDGVSSDVWRFSVVDWYCDILTKPQWDCFYDIDCIVTFEDFAYFAGIWMERDNMSLDEGETGGIDTFMSEWLVISGRTP